MSAYGARAGALKSLLLLLLTLAVASPVPAKEGTLDKAVKTSVGAMRKDAASQKKIDALAEDTRDMLQDYRLVLRQTESLHVYNDHLERLTASQLEEMESIGHQLDELEFTSQGIVPLMVRMVDALAVFVDLDVPFLLDERHKRIEALRSNMDRADVSIAEQYRRIMEAYQIEMEYGRTIEAYTGTLERDGQNRSVNYLRVGRVAFLYQTLDGVESGIWDEAAGNWSTLPDEYRSSVSKGLRIAKKQQAPDLLNLPIAAPERVQ